MDQEDSIDSEARNHERYEAEIKTKNKSFVVPDSKVKFRACDKCRLIKSEDQWIKSSKCQNCTRQFRDKQDYKKFTSNKFEGIVSIIDPSRSWIRRKLMLGKNIVSGVYAVNML